MTVVQQKKILEKIVGLENDIEALKKARTQVALSGYASATLSSSGGSKSYTRLDLDKMREQFRPRAERQVKTRLALEKIAELENLTVTDEDTEAEIKKIADMYGLETDKVKEQVSPDMLAEDIKVGKAVDIVKANAVITDKAPEAAE